MTTAKLVIRDGRYVLVFTDADGTVTEVTHISALAWLLNQ